MAILQEFEIRITFSGQGEASAIAVFRVELASTRDELVTDVTRWASQSLILLPHLLGFF